MINCYNSLNSLTNKFSYDVVAKIQRDIYIFTCIFVLFRLSKTEREHIAAVSEEAVICTSLVMWLCFCLRSSVSCCSRSFSLVRREFSLEAACHRVPSGKKPSNDITFYGCQHINWLDSSQISFILSWMPLQQFQQVSLLLSHQLQSPALPAVGPQCSSDTRRSPPREWPASGWTQPSPEAQPPSLHCCCSPAWPGRSWPLLPGGLSDNRKKEGFGLLIKYLHVLAFKVMIPCQFCLLPLSLALSWLESPSGSGVSGFRLRPSPVRDFSGSLFACS